MCKRLNYFLFAFVLFSFYSCVRENKLGSHWYITFINNSDRDVSVSYIAWSPDTLCQDIRVTHNNPSHYRVAAHTVNYGALDLRPYKTWETYISKLSSGIVTFFVHDASISDSICNDKSIDWKFSDEFEYEAFTRYLNEQIIIRRYYYTLEDLESIKWTITYP